jgi:hypothetical protein
MKLTISLIAVSIVLAGAGLCQEPPPVPPETDAKMKATHEEMQAEMKMMDERLDKLVIDMNTSATPEKKLDAAIAVINEMVAQHKKMRERAMQHVEESHHFGPGAHKRNQD